MTPTHRRRAALVGAIAAALAVGAWALRPEGSLRGTWAGRSENTRLELTLTADGDRVTGHGVLTEPDAVIPFRVDGTAVGRTFSLRIDRDGASAAHVRGYRFARDSMYATWLDEQGKVSFTLTQ